MALLIKADGQLEPIHEPLTLEAMQRLVDGYIEMVTLGAGPNRRDVLIVDEDGRRKQKPLNHRATHLYRLDTIVGDAILCTVIDPGEKTERIE